MRIYSKLIFPRIMEMAMSQPNILELRKSTLSEISGNILEIGFGTGINLLCYPDHIRKITAIDTNEGMHSLARKKLFSSQVEVDLYKLDAENLPFEDSTFDSIVSTFTLCSVNDVARSLYECQRVLRPDGKLFFLEHGLSHDKNIQIWQNRLNPLQNILGDGCNLNRNIPDIIQKRNFRIASLKQFYLNHVPKILGCIYKGIAIKN